MRASSTKRRSNETNSGASRYQSLRISSALTVVRFLVVAYAALNSCATKAARGDRSTSSTVDASPTTLRPFPRSSTLDKPTRPSSSTHTHAEQRPESADDANTRGFVHVKFIVPTTPMANLVSTVARLLKCQIYSSFIENTLAAVTIAGLASGTHRGARPRARSAEHPNLLVVDRYLHCRCWMWMRKLASSAP